MNKTPREKLFTKGSCLPLACLPIPNDFVVHKTMTSRNVKVVLQGRTSVPDFQDPRCINFNLQLLQKIIIIIILISVLPTQFQQNSALNSMCRRIKNMVHLWTWGYATLVDSIYQIKISAPHFICNWHRTPVKIWACCSHANAHKHVKYVLTILYFWPIS